MKVFVKLMLVLFAVSSSGQLALAQTTKAQKKEAKRAALKAKIDSDHFVFEANYVNPQRGSGRALTSEYDLRVSPDTIVSYLPYFGRAYVAPTNPLEGGIKFTSTKFAYTKTKNKKGGWSILIKPKDKNISDMRDVNSLQLNISEDGYASLQVMSTNREQISFDGVIKESN